MMFMEQAESEIKPDIMVFWKYKEMEFFEIENIRFQDNKIDLTERVMARIQIKLDRKHIKTGIIVENFVHFIE